MTPSEYQKLCKRTECPQPVVYQKDTKDPWIQTLIDKPALLHGALGIASEGGELLAEMQRWIWYKKDLNETNIKEEIGDVLWYVAEICNALGWDMGEVMTANISKLKTRYPEKYTDHLSAEENETASKKPKHYELSLMF